MNGKRVLITGGNTGMGLASAKALAQKGAHVIITSRNNERGINAVREINDYSGHASAEMMLCDLASLESIRAFCQAFISRWQTLDVLINNAGVVETKRSETTDGFEKTIGVNHLGPFLLTNLLLDKIKAAPQGRIIMVSSGAHKWGRIDFEDPHLKKEYSVWKAYGQSKLANILFALSLDQRLSGTPVTVNSLHPGAVSTSLGVNRETGFGRGIHAVLRPFFQTSEEGAATAVYLASSPEAASVSGKYFENMQPIVPSNTALDRNLAEDLWKWSEKEINDVN